MSKTLIHTIICNLQEIILQQKSISLIYCFGQREQNDAKLSTAVFIHSNCINGL